MPSYFSFGATAQKSRAAITGHTLQFRRVSLGQRNGGLNLAAPFVRMVHTKDHSANSETSQLHEINNQTLGAAAGSFPVVTLPNGDKLPTGTVGALLVNIKAYDKGNEQERKAIEPAIRAAVPVLQKVGMFDLFSPEEWVAGGSPGRILVGKLALSQR